MPFSHPINLPGPILLQSVGLGLLAGVGWVEWNEDALYAPYDTPVIYMSALLLVLRQAGNPHLFLSSSSRSSYAKPGSLPLFHISSSSSCQHQTQSLP